MSGRFVNVEMVEKDDRGEDGHGDRRGDQPGGGAVSGLTWRETGHIEVHPGGIGRGGALLYRPLGAWASGRCQMNG